MRKELNKSRYVLAAILTIVVFVSGLSVGLVIEKARLIASEKTGLEQRLELSSLQVQQLYLDMHNINSCDSIQNLLESNMGSLDQSMKSLIDYNKKSMVNKEDFELNLRNYFVTELQYFLISEKLKKSCELNSVDILYFYTETEQSDTQGYVLDFVKKKFGDKVMIFSFNANFNKEPMISMLTSSYGLGQYPAIVINGKKFEGQTSEEDISSEICKNIKNASTYCL